MPVTSNTLRVEGLRQLQSAFALSEHRIGPDLRKTLREVAEPVRQDAEELAAGRIANVGYEWSRMRVGVTRQYVYVAPKKRGSRVAARKRKNLAPMLLGRALVPALDQNAELVERRVEEMLEVAAVRWSREP